MTYEIRKNIPLPAKKKGGRPVGISKYPFAQMQVGDSFLVPDTTIKKFAGTVYSARKRTGFTLELRALETGVGVWRTA